MKQNSAALHTSIEKLKEAGACTDRFLHLLRGLGYLVNDPQMHGGKRRLAHSISLISSVKRSAPINLLTVLKIGGVADCLWALSATFEDSDKLSRTMAADFAEEVLPLFVMSYPRDKRPRHAIETARRYVQGLATLAEMECASWDAHNSAKVADNAAKDAALCAARAAYIASSGNAKGWYAALKTADDAAYAAVWGVVGTAIEPDVSWEDNIVDYETPLAELWAGYVCDPVELAWRAVRARQERAIRGYLRRD